MKIALLHNYYQIKGGEDAVLEQERNLLLNGGNEVSLYTISNDSITSFYDKFKVFLQAHYSSSSKQKIKNFLERFRPDIVHVHNFFPLLTPSIFDACNELKIPAVLTVHNFRLICPSALLMHDGQIYEKAIRGSAYKTVFDRVYKNSLLGTLSVAHMIEHHKKKRTWQVKVSKIICLTEFQKSKFLEAGFKSDNIRVKPNFKINTVSESDLSNQRNGRALFVGRLSHEKGLELLLDAFSNLPYDLDVVGDGDLEFLKSTAPGNIHFLGHLPREQVEQKMLSASVLLMPSIWYEGFPMVLVEAFSNGLPVICSDIGSMAEIVEHGKTGMHFKKGDMADLREKIVQLLSDHNVSTKMGKKAREVYLEKYTDRVNYRILMKIYQEAMSENKIITVHKAKIP